MKHNQLLSTHPGATCTIPPAAYCPRYEAPDMRIYPSPITTSFPTSFQLPCMQDTSQRTSSSSARLGVPSHIPPDQRSPISSHLEEGTDRSVIALQGPQLLPGGFLQLGIEAPGGAALHGEEERNLLERKGAGLGGKEPLMGRSHPSLQQPEGWQGLLSHDAWPRTCSHWKSG